MNRAPSRRIDADQSADLPGFVPDPKQLLIHIKGIRGYFNSVILGKIILIEIEVFCARISDDITLC
jgi:hypothetical protein